MVVPQSNSCDMPVNTWICYAEAMRIGLFWYQNSANGLFATRRRNRVIAMVPGASARLDLHESEHACKFISCCSARGTSPPENSLRAGVVVV